MKKSKFSESQIIGVLKEAEAGIPVPATLPRSRHQQRHILQVAVEVRWHGCVDDDIREGT